LWQTLISTSVCCNSIRKLQESGEDDVRDEEVLSPPSYHDIRKRLFNDTKNKVKVQIV
jgi:hypothetical protein